ncbi:MAG TPA: TonB-dependent receptor [Steroidobacteraceae bacterium]
MLSARLIVISVLGSCAGIELSIAAESAAGGETAVSLDQGGVISEIVVTARKRSQTAQSVPATIQALDGERLAMSGIIDTRDLPKATPSLSVAPAFRETFVALRGITNNVRSLGADPSVAVNFNGIYLPRTTMLLTELYDVERIEVLKGPQGDLYGRNATGGAINVLSREPEPGFSAEAFAGVGSYDLRRTQGAVNLGNDVVALRVSGAIAEDDGYTKNAFNGSRLDHLDFESFRVALGWKPTSDIDVTAFWHQANDESSIGYLISADPAFGLDPSQFGYVGLAGPENLRLSPRRVRSNQPLELGRKGEIAGLTASLDLGAVTLKSITGYTRFESEDRYDTDGTSAPIEYTDAGQRYRSFSQEVQLLSAAGQLIDWVVGGYFYRDRGTDRYSNPFNDNIGTDNPPSYSSHPNHARLKGKSVAAYGQGTIHLSPSLDLIVGGRYTRDEKTGFSTIDTEVNVDETVRFEKFTPSAQLVWTPHADLMLYGGVSTGFKSGGLNFLDTSGFPSFEPENITAYEVGLKSRPFDASIVNVSAFYYDYRDIQLRTSFFFDPNDPKVAITNASSAEVWGVELQAQSRLIGPLELDANVAYLSTSVSGYVSPTNGAVLNGRELPMSPQWSGNVGLLIELPIADLGDLRLRAEYAFRSEILFPYTYDAEADTINDGYSGVVNATARFTFRGERVYLELIGRNLNDGLYRTFHANFPPFVRFDGFGPPRTVEGRIGIKF